MNELGKVHVSGQERMARVLQSRRTTSGVTGLVQKALGLESKMRQYEVGESFVEAVELEAGPHGLDPVWRAPENLPTLDELREPSVLARASGVAATLQERAARPR